jgi:DNA-directed RNA polymerase specialized sigma24 family protein
MPVERSDILRQRLAGLREQRRQARLADEELRERTRKAVREADEAGVPIAEIARLLQMDRSSVYRTYLDATAA